MPYQPVDYGNALLKAEQINALRARNDPNSLNNQILAEKLNQLKNPTMASPLGVSDISLKDFTAPSVAEAMRSGDLNTLKRYNRPDQPYKVDTGTEIEFWGIDRATRQPVLIKGIPKNIGEAEAAKVSGGLGAKMGEGGGYSAGDVAADVVTREIQAKSDAQAKLPENIAKESRVLADNLGVQDTISELLTPDDSGRTKLSYAYGRANAILPDSMKATGWVDAESLRNRVVASLQLENVKKLKGTGPITENEQKILANAASVLNNPLISPELAEREMMRVNAMFKSWARENEAAIQRGTGQSNAVNWEDL